MYGWCLVIGLDPLLMFFWLRTQDLFYGFKFTSSHFIIVIISAFFILTLKLLISEDDCDYSPQLNEKKSLYFS